MIRIYLILPAFTIFLTPAFSSAQTIRLIPQIGANVSTYAIEYFDQSRHNIRFAPAPNAGVALNIAMNERRFLSIQPEINYMWKRFSFEELYSPNEPDYEPGVISGSIRRNIHYVEIPLLAKVDFGINTRYHLNAGPTFAYALGGRETTRGDNRQEESHSLNFDRVNRTDWGIQIGAGVEIPVSDSFIVIDGRYGVGFRPLNKAYEIPGSEGSEPIQVAADGKNRLFSLTVGYALPLN
jgi:hypothetical protein